jgi:hypothetical protein
MLQELEAAISDILAQKLGTQARVMAFPETPVQQGSPLGVAAVYVRFSGVNLSRHEGGRSPYYQSGSVDFEVRVLAKDLRSHTGAYPIIEQILGALAGWKPNPRDGWSFALPGFQMVGCELVERLPEYSLWDWGMRWQIGCIYEQNLE